MRVRPSALSSWIQLGLGLCLAAGSIALAGSLAGCTDTPGEDTGGQYVDADLPDAAKNPGFRDGGDCPSGGSGGGSGTGQCCAGGSGGGSGTCQPAPDAAPACGEHTFVFDSATAQTVLVTGSFTSWASMPPGALPMQKSGNGHFTLTKVLGPGKFTYKFIVDGVWTVDPANPDHENDGVGGQNSVITLCGPG